MKYTEYFDKIFERRNKILEQQFEYDHLVKSMANEDMPEKGFTTAITYGLSQYIHQEWQLGRPELSITVESKRLEWARIVGYVANTLGKDFPFLYGQLIN